MSNSINDLNAIYSSQIQEAPTGVGLSKTKVGADTITPEDAAAVGQHVRAIKYEARKSGEPLPRAYNEYVSKNNLTATQRRITRQKLGLAEETSMPHVSKNDKKAIKTRYKGLFKKDLKGNVAGVNENLSDWREDFELREVEMPSTGVTKKKRPKTSDKSGEEITDKDVNNKVIINPTMGELTNSFEIELEKIGGTLVEMVEIKEAMVDQLPVSPAELIIQKRMAMLNMRLARKSREKVNKIKKGDAGVKDEITAQPPEKVKVKKPEAQTEDAKYGYDSKGDSLNPKDKKKKKETLEKIKKDAQDILKQDEIHRKIEEDYKSKKTSEVIKALTKKKSSFKKRYGKDAPDVMYAVAAKTAKKKGDTSKSDDRYAYESKLWDQVAENLTELGEMNDVEFRVVGLDESELEEARRADKMGIARKKVTYDKGEETRNPNPDRGATSLRKPAGSSLSGSRAASRARSLGDARRKANRKGANLAYGDREGRLSSFATTKRQSDADLGAQKAATDTGAHKDKKTGYRQDHKYGERGDKRRPSYNPKHTANK